MLYKKGDLVNVDHYRKGRFVAEVTKDFDADDPKIIFYPLILAQKKPVGTLSIRNSIEKGESIPCRKEFCTLIKF